MEEYITRSYRGRFDGGRWRFMSVRYKETDLYIGVDRMSYDPGMERFALREVVALREKMERYLARDLPYVESIVPYVPASDAPEILHRMAEAAGRAGVGPMAAVAGAVAEHVGRCILRRFGSREIIVENGGDIYAHIRSGVDVSVFAGKSPLSGNVGIGIPCAGDYGICTSAGTVGPSLSFGTADAVMTVCGNAALADAYATAFANRIRSVADVGSVIGEMRLSEDILGAVCVKDDMLGICGRYRLKIWNGMCGRPRPTGSAVRDCDIL